jgi:hypothetical protein
MRFKRFIKKWGPKLLALLIVLILVFAGFVVILQSF